MCEHEGFHGISTRYDRRTHVLVYFEYCETCGRTLSEIDRLDYEPRFRHFAVRPADPPLEDIATSGNAMLRP